MQRQGVLLVGSGSAQCHLQPGGLWDGRRLKSTLDIGVKQVYEVEVLTKSGEPRSVMVSVSPLHGVDGEILGVLGIARDMTDTKKLEQQIRNSEKLASVGKLAAGVAHEINNPLGGILNCLYNMRKGTLSPLRQEEYLASMEDGLRRVQRIVRQLLDFSQQHNPELALADINQVVNRVLLLTDHLFVPHRVQLETDLAGDMPEIMIDRHMMEQVLMNLVLKDGRAGTPIFTFGFDAVTGALRRVRPEPSLPLRLP